MATVSTNVVAVPFDLSGSEGLNFGNALKYQDCWTIFDRIQIINAQVSTIRSGGDKTRTYYQFSGHEERTQFIWGRILHIRRYPNSNWDVVRED